MGNSKMPLITVVIPTRERADTLKFTLETVLDQESDSFEIVVSDNFSQDNTKEVVEGFLDSRITYVNTGRRLSMVDNWEFALQHARGEYVIYIGDDDGMMPGAIDKLQRLMEAFPSPIYCWRWHEYTWPIDGMNPEIVSIVQATSTFELDLNELVRFSIKWGAWRSNALPGLYHSAVSKRILDDIREKTGRVFHSMAPDIFMQFSLPVFSNKVLSVGECLTINGRSAKSNGGSWIAKEGAAHWQRFVQEYGAYRIHPTLFPEAPVLVNIIPDSTLVAMDLFPEFYKGMKFDYAAMWAYLQQSLHYEGVWGILHKRRQIGVYHYFNTGRFLFCCLIHKALALRTSLRRMILKKSLSRLVLDYPKDIRACVKVISDFQVRQKSSEDACI